MVLPGFLNRCGWHLLDYLCRLSQKFGGSICEGLRSTIGIAQAKNRRPWTVPALSTPAQCERWSDLMPIVTWQLWLARQLVAQRPLPWQKSLVKLTPGRVAQSFGSILAVLGTPAQPPKLRGKSPGWSKGRKRRSRIRYPVVKKGFSRAEKDGQKVPLTISFEPLIFQCIQPTVMHLFILS